ncbi:hypothetical protein [Massilia pseudoviolaceinigra]|uniref:hypothetical protein n=1 Tax=Massilia pseudoviolaceinigra TaxID=3057165 RepID=UPI002796DF75|nr:hypothetical protein [Massilia sp. CCM 9206]MDQ1921673.1 hypothetical protein [Massilia sp. CCM 9206]
MKAAITIALAAALCSACEPPDRKVEYTCTPAQREAAQVEAQREIDVVGASGAWERGVIYDAALARNCVVKP